MGDDKPHLTIVGDNYNSFDGEFAPLPYYPFEERPVTYELSQEECATAIHLAEGHLPRAAALLKVSLVRLNRLLRGSPRLQRVFEEASGLVVARAFSKYIEALDSEDARRQEWGATKVMQSRAAIGHLFSPAPAMNVQSNVNVGTAQREIIFRWKSPSDSSGDSSGDSSSDSGGDSSDG